MKNNLGVRKAHQLGNSTHIVLPLECKDTEYQRFMDERGVITLIPVGVEMNSNEKIMTHSKEIELILKIAKAMCEKECKKDE